MAWVVGKRRAWGLTATVGSQISVPQIHTFNIAPVGIACAFQKHGPQFWRLQSGKPKNKYYPTAPFADLKTPWSFRSIDSPDRRLHQ